MNLATDCGSSVLPVANGGTGTGTWTNGQIPIGNTTGNTLVKATITPVANQTTVTNGAGSITIGTVQDIGTGSSPTFAGMTLSGKLNFSGSNKIIQAGGTDVLTVAAGGIAVSGTSNVVTISNLTQTNDTSVQLVYMQSGADVTLGPMIQYMGAHVSATGINRYAYWGVGDSLSTRLLCINFDGVSNFGNASIGTNVTPSGATQNLVFGGSSATLGAATSGLVSCAGIGSSGDKRFTVQGSAGSAISLGNDRLNYGASTGLISINGTDVVTITAGNLKAGGASTGSADTRLTLGGTGNGGSGRGSAILIRGPGSSSEVDLVKLIAYTTGGATASQTSDLAIQTSLSGTLSETARFVSDGSFQITGKVTKYNNISTVANGVAALVATGRFTAQTAAKASVMAYTVGAADGSFEVLANVLVTTSTTHSFTVTVAYTDEGNTARTATMSFQQLAGGAPVTVIANAAGAVPYSSLVLPIRCKASTTITVATTGTFTTVTYNVESFLKQVA